MDFLSSLSQWTPKQIAEASGCTVRTAYNWKTGSVLPPEWRHPMILAQLKAKLGRKVHRKSFDHSGTYPTNA